MYYLTVILLYDHFFVSINAIVIIFLILISLFIFCNYFIILIIEYACFVKILITMIISCIFISVFGSPNGKLMIMTIYQYFFLD